MVMRVVHESALVDHGSALGYVTVHGGHCGVERGQSA